MRRAFADGGSYGGRAKYIKPLLESVGILDWFGAVVTADDVENHKPARIPS